MKEFPNAMQAIGWMFDQGLHLPAKDDKGQDNEKAIQLKQDQRSNRWIVEQTIKGETDDRSGNY